MSDVEKIDLVGLRKRLTAIIVRPATTVSDPRDGSLYLRALTCCWLAAEDGSAEEQQLERLFTEQAEFEGLSAKHSDKLLSDILLLGMP